MRVLVLLAVLTLAACSPGGSPDGGATTLTLDDARARLDEYVGQTVAALPAGAELGDPLSSPFRPTLCDEAIDADPEGPVRARTANWVRGLDPAGNQRALEAFATHWTAKGWKITLDRRPGDGYVVVTAPTDYALTLAVTPDGTKLSLSGASPCSGQ